MSTGSTRTGVCFPHVGLRIGEGAGKEVAGGQARGLMRTKQWVHSLRLYDPHCEGANPPIHLSVCPSIYLFS